MFADFATAVCPGIAIDVLAAKDFSAAYATVRLDRRSLWLYVGRQRDFPPLSNSRRVMAECSAPTKNQDPLPRSRGLAVIGLRHVAAQSYRCAALPLDHRLRLLGSFQVGIQEKHVRPAARQQNRNGTAVPNVLSTRSRTGDKRDAAVKATVGQVNENIPSRFHILSKTHISVLVVTQIRASLTPGAALGRGAGQDMERCLAI